MSLQKSFKGEPGSPQMEAREYLANAFRISRVNYADAANLRDKCPRIPADSVYFDEWKMWDAAMAMDNDSKRPLHTLSAIHTTHMKAQRTGEAYALIRYTHAHGYRLSYFEGSTYVEIEVMVNGDRITAQASLRWETWNANEGDKGIVAWTTQKEMGLFTIFAMLRRGARIAHNQHIQDLNNG